MTSHVADQMEELLKRFRKGEISENQLTILSLPLQVEGMKLTRQKMVRYEAIKNERDSLAYTVKLLKGFICSVELAEEYNEYCVINRSVH